MKKTLRFRNIIFMFLAAGGNVWGPTTELHEAARKGDSKRVMYLLFDKGANVNAKDDDGNTPLIMVAKERLQYTSIIAEILIDDGADVNAANNNGYTPLHMAVKTNNEQLVKLLLDKNADVSKLNKNNRKPIDCILPRTPANNNIRGMLQNAEKEKSNAELFDAIIGNEDNRNYDKIERLIQDGANVNATDNSKRGRGYSPLMMATYFGYYDVAKLLIEHKANIHAVTRDSRSTILWLAVSNGRTEIVRLLLESGATKDLDKDIKPGITLRTTIQGWTHNIKPEILEMLRDAQAQQASSSGASRNTSPRINQVDKTQQLFDAIRGNEDNRNYDKIERLIQDGANVNATDDSARGRGYSPLMMATCFGYYDVAKLLIESEANIHAVTKNKGYPILWLAITNGHTEIVKLLLKNGATKDLDKKIEPSTTLRTAIERLPDIKPEIQEMLRDAQAQQASSSGASRSTSPRRNQVDQDLQLFDAIACDNADEIERLLTSGVNENVRNEMGWSPLSCALRTNKFNAAKLLINKDAYINAVDQDPLKYTPLDIAIIKNQNEMVNLLLDHKAGMPARNNNDKTPMGMPKGKPGY